ncbi:two component transcriptional regulator, LuxR family [Methyloglobulus morosus KoM1]|uniref:Two component transcriptional regulator, LuxR family n=1 Tax=Methyloglobulus morosus KoM1 TaxID=1116472 RepID=V5C189_9GAMM|nr:response regulator transcription factor [Methyloglobulus morosus]ESS73864.1 two component transcriptional regulator, LuxR family [Methyloglobulus morosus KoM1]
MYKISIIENQPIIREGLCSLLRMQSGLDVLGGYSDIVDFLRDHEVLPDVVLLDLNLCSKNEIDNVRKLKNLFLYVKIIIFSTTNNEQCIKCAFQAGVHGFVNKDATPEQIYNAVSCVAQGQIYLGPSILPIVINGFILSQNQARPVDTSALTARERELVRLITEGYKNKEIANILCLSVKTIESHRSNLMKKLQVHNVAGLMTKANQFI